jgi:hypothetical protein
MNDNHDAACSRDTRLENFTADLTDVAYRVAVRHGVGDKWLDLQLDLWRVLTDAIEKRSSLHPTREFEQFNGLLAAVPPAS